MLEADENFVADVVEKALTLKNDEYVIEPEVRRPSRPVSHQQQARRAASAQSNPRVSPLDYLKSEYNKEKRIYERMISQKNKSVKAALRNGEKDDKIADMLKQVPDVSQEIKDLEEKFTGLINENGKVESYENQGKKKLAYEVKKNK